MQGLVGRYTPFLISALLVHYGCGEGTPPAPPIPEPVPVELVVEHYVGANACADCHAEQAERWHGSHHDLAMQEASAASVLGDFAEATFSERGATTRFFRRDDEFWVQIDESDGSVALHEVRYTFGVDPLQQFLVEPEPGRLQALTVAWDTRPVSDGGQRWFSLQPEESTSPGDVLHWNGIGNRWNYMCAHCHSTNVEKGFDPGSGSYETQWSEIDVACEACHGPGDAHVAWAQSDPRPNTRNGLRVQLPRSEASWKMDPSTGIAQLDGPRDSGPELETCAPCHSRRGLLSEGAGSYHDNYRLMLLEEGLYYRDGQIRDEVYVFGSFLQSRMHAAGVRCSDCHDPHSLSLRGTTESVCGQCHEPARFATIEHHHHPVDTEAARCVNCHMPARTYMEVDARRDHSIRVPEPHVSAALGSPDACTACHADQTQEWAGKIVEGWGERSNRHSVPTAIVRATRLAEQRFAPRPELERAVREARQDPDPLVRRAAAAASMALPLNLRPDAIGPLVKDPVRSVRLEAALSLAESSTTPGLSAALDEYRAVQRLNADDPSAYVNLGLLHQRLGESQRAEDAYKRAIRMSPFFIPGYLNLADLYRTSGREKDADQVLRDGLRIHESSPEIHHALGLSLVRQQRLAEALESLGRAASLAPEVPRFSYVYGVGLHSTGQTDRGLEELERAHRRHPADRELLEALASISRDVGRNEAAAAYFQKLQALTE